MLYVIVWLLKKPSFLGKSDMVDEENKHLIWKPTKNHETTLKNHGNQPKTNQSINLYSFHQPYLIFQEKKAYSVATLYPNISKVTDYYISVEKISNWNCLEEELLEVLPKAKGAVASNVEGVEPGSC